MFLGDAYGLFWLLLPVAAASGWYAARRASANASNREKHQDFSSNYLKGLNYLLNEQPDKAIEVFIKMLEVDSETVETHLALGNLFRRRGEVERAIRIHQNLIAKTSLSDEERSLAVLELGMDYMRSGLLDRAEDLFKELHKSGRHLSDCLKQLIEIYQQEQDWEAAIACARELESQCGEDMSRFIAQFYCEEAEQSIRKGDHSRAASLLKQALDTAPGCARASLMEGHITLKAGQPGLALQCYQRIERQDPDFLVEAIGPIKNCYQAIGRVEEFGEYARLLSRKYGGVPLLLSLTDHIVQEQGVDEAMNYLRQELRKRPSLRGLDRFIEYTLPGADGQAKQHLAVIKDVAGQWLQRKPAYQCRHCGFLAKTLHWQCPGCKYWSTVKPINEIEGE
jgi:lipopolysaccharide biosynthesis regulator YciM